MDSLARTPRRILLVGGLPQVGFALPAAAGVHHAVAELIRRRLVNACHDVSDGGWLVALAEMAIGGDRGATVGDAIALEFGPFEERRATYLVETHDVAGVAAVLGRAGVPHGELAIVCEEAALRSGELEASVNALRTAWSGSQG